MIFHAVFGGVFFVSFLIGLIAFVLGCNPNLDNQCIAYNMVEGTVYDYKFTTQSCKKCVSHSNNHCNRYDYYPCYSAYVKFHYGGNETCDFETKKDSRSQSAAQSSVNGYDMGEKNNLLKVKSGPSCSEPTTGLISWGVGVAFLAFSGLVLCAWLGFCMVFGCHYSGDDTMISSIFAYGSGNTAKVVPTAEPVASMERF